MISEAINTSLITKYMEYSITYTSEGLAKHIKNVQKYLDMGFVPQGGVSITIDEGDIIFSQAIIRKGIEAPPKGSSTKE